jgi:hypothetical protein
MRFWFSSFSLIVFPKFFQNFGNTGLPTSSAINFLGPELHIRYRTCNLMTIISNLEEVEMVMAEGLADGKQNMSSLLNKPQTKDKVYYINMTLMHVYTIFS